MNMVSGLLSVGIDLQGHVHYYFTIMSNLTAIIRSTHESSENLLGLLLLTLG